MERRFAAAVITVALSTISANAMAQATAPATPPAEAGAAAPVATQQGGLEEIIVTATKRSENLQNVPVAISAISASQLQAQGVFETSDLNGKMPNLQVSSPYGKQQPNFSIRGVGVGTEFNSNAASPVGIYVDEVYQAFRSSHGQQLFDLNQIEVVRGPQGTLYGRNTTGGAINFITRAPDLHGENGYATLGYGSYHRFTAEGAMEITPVAGVLGIRIAATYEQSNPYLHNVLPAGLNTSAAGGASGLNYNSGVQPGGGEAYGIRGTIRYKPSDILDVSLKGYIGSSVGGTEVPLPFGQSKTSDTINYTSPNFLLGSLFSALAPAGLVPASYSRDANGLAANQVQTNSIGRALSNAAGVVLNAKIKLADDLHLVSITGYDGGHYLQSATDCDSTPLSLCDQKYESTFQSFNQDFRFDYARGPLKVIAGLYYGQDHLTTNNGLNFFEFLSDVTTAVGLPASYFNPGGAFNGKGLSPTSLPTAITGTQHFQQRRISKAIYGEGTYDISPTVKLTVGGRYTADRNLFYDGIATYYDNTGAARLLTVSNYQQGGAYAPYFLAPVYNEAGVQVIPSSASQGNPMPGPLVKLGESNRFTGRAILDWKPTDQTLVYTSYSRGYRAGTFNGLAYASANQVYFVKPEQIDAFEAGFKTRFLDNKLQFNGAFYYYIYKGQQGQVVDATATANLVSLDGKEKGIELDVQYALTHHLRLSGSFGWIDSAYNHTTCPSTPLSGFPAQYGNCVQSSGGAVDVGGNPFPYAAKFSGTAGVDWDGIAAGPGVFDLHADADYTGHYYYDAFADYSRGPLTHVTTGQFTEGGGKYVLVNARATYTIGRYSIAGFVKNATNKLYYPFGIALENLFGNDYRVQAAPRTFGAEVTAKF